MSDYQNIFKSEKAQNWFKCCLAVRFAREGIIDFIADETVKLKTEITQRISTTKSLPRGTTCTDCSTAALGVIPCPTRNVCRKRHGRCLYHITPVRPCPNRICDDFRQQIKQEHRFKAPSWRNTDATGWSVNPWEVAKCFLPPDGYLDVQSADVSDFNGIISVLVNCKWFAASFQDDLSKDSNVCTKARDVGRELRHCANFEVSDDTATKTFATLLDLLEDPGYLQSDENASKAREKIRQLKAGTLTITSTDVATVQEEIERIQYSKIKEEFCGDLKTLYCQRHQTVPISPLMPTVDDELGKLYVTPKFTYISRKTDNSMPLLGGVTETGEQVTTYSGIFYRDGLKARNVYIQGEPGTGKSTFCVHLVSAWCESQTTSSSQGENASSSPVERQINVDSSQGENTSSSSVERETNADSSQGENTSSSPVERQTNSDNSQGENTSSSPVDRQTNADSSQGGVDSPPVERQPKVSNNTDTEHFADDYVLQEFDFLFLVTLRNAHEHECNIEDMIRNQIISEIASHEQYDDAFVARILDEEKCLIIMDGLDEWSHPDNKTNTCPRNPKSIPHRKIWKNCTYLTTTRPWKMNAIGIKDSDIDSQIGLYGLESPQSMTQKVINCLNDKFGKSRDLSEFEHQLENKRLQHIFQIPILLMQLICVWFEDQTLGNSKCEIYSNMIDMMFERALKTFLTKVPSYNRSSSVELPHCFKETNCCKEYRHFLKSLSELAFNTLLSHDRESTIVFGEVILVQYLSKDEQQLAFKTGILSQHKPLMSLTRSRYTYYFVHKTFQEFLAALYISLNPSPTILQQVFEVYGRSVDVLDISAIFVFVCGMNSRLATNMSVQITKVFNENYGKCLCTYKIYAVYQHMLLDGYTEGINNGHKNTNLDFQHSSIYYSNLSISDRTNLKCLLDMNAGKLLTYHAWNNVPMEEIKEEISRNKRLTWVTLVDISSSGHDTLDMSRHRNLEVLVLAKVEGININFNINLTQCVLCYVSREHETSVLTTLLHRVSRLKQLGVRECNNISLLLRVLSSAPKLQHVLIVDTVLRDNDIILTNSVNDVELVRVSMSLRSCRTLVDSMTRIPHSVGCKLEQCTVTPVEEFDTLRKYISESDLFVVTENNDDTFEFETIPRINKNKKRCVIN